MQMGPYYGSSFELVSLHAFTVVIAGSIKRLTMGMLKLRYPLVRVPLYILCIARIVPKSLFGVTLTGAEIGLHHQHQSPKLLEITWLDCFVRNGDVIKCTSQRLCPSPGWSNQDLRLLF